jgi:tRNA threonylcarbamoyladenosine biosynthesis protein TsaB
VRILGIETSSTRGSVALLDSGRSVCCLEHARENAHGESMLPLIERALDSAGWLRSQVERIAVGVGPGSFTGLRVGIALAQGLAEGLGVPLVGVPSLKAIALAVPADRAGSRCVLVDARRGELFLAAYDSEGAELLPVRLVPSAEAAVAASVGLPEPIFVGSGAALLGSRPDVLCGPETDYPHARWVALAAREALADGQLRALYVRDAGAVIPRLPENPLRAAGAGLTPGTAEPGSG